MQGKLVVSIPPISVRDEGTTQGNAGAINFVGDGVSASVSGDVATVTITSTTNQANVLKFVSFRG